MQLALVFVYNANKGTVNWLKDWVHKTVSPGTYPCRLTALTFSSLSVRPSWRSFVDSLPVASRFLHRDELFQEYGIDTALPAVFLEQDRNLSLWISAKEINECSTLPELIALVQRRLAKTIDENGWDWLRMGVET